jgi:hypothetical protein
MHLWSVDSIVKEAGKTQIKDACSHKSLMGQNINDIFAFFPLTFTLTSHFWINETEFTTPLEC